MHLHTSSANIVSVHQFYWSWAVVGGQAAITTPCLQLCVIGSIDDGKEKEEEELPDHHIYNWWDFDRAAFGDVKQIATEQAHDVALVAMTPWGKVQALCDVCKTVLVRVSSVCCSNQATKLAGEKIP